MDITVNKVDVANTLLSGVIAQSTIDQTIDKLAKDATRYVKVDGFRPGKVPVAIVKKLHQDKLENDAEAQVVRDFVDNGIKQATLNAEDIVGEPHFKKFEKTDAGIEIEVEVSTKPHFEAEGYREIIPTFEKPIVNEEDVAKRVEESVKQHATHQPIETPKAIEEGDMAIIDFEGFLDGEAFAGGKAEKFSLKIGSGQFIPGFEEQLIGMVYEEERTINITFPAEYQAPNLASKETQFKIKLHEIHTEVIPELNDELAKKIMKSQEEHITVESLKERIRDQLVRESLSKLYQEELKPKLLEALVVKFDFALPNNIVEQEIDAKVNQKAKTMSKEEIESYKSDDTKIEALREEIRPEATDSVKATFIIDVLAKKEQISVSDDEVAQTLYYEAYMSGQDPQQVIKYYEENNLLPAIKMEMIEDKLFTKLLGLDA